MVSYSTFEPTTKIPSEDQKMQQRIHKKFGLYRRYLSSDTERLQKNRNNEQH